MTRGERRVGARLRSCGARGLLHRTALLVAFWAVLASGDPKARAFGVPVVVAALVASLALPAPPAARWRPIGLALFALAFLVESLRAGTEVALRALAPGLPIAPALVRYDLRLPPGAARHLFLGALNLMPGSLGLDVRGRVLEVHLLVNEGDASIRSLARFEERVARALGEALEPAHG